MTTTEHLEALKNDIESLIDPGIGDVLDLIDDRIQGIEDEE